MAFVIGTGAGLPAVATAQVASTPYTGTAVKVPGTFEAENFDRGGAGVAYKDNVKGNAGGQYRTSEDVDIVVSADSAGGGYVVNNFETGEWLAYTIDVPATGVYELAIRASSAFPNSAFRIEVDGVNVTGRVTVPNTGNWNTFEWVGKSGIRLTAGKHVVKLVAEQQYFNVNQLRVAAAPKGTPYSGTPAALPGTVEAENFDKGGEGLGYHDKAKGNAGGQYRTTEDVDIVVSTDSEGGGYVVNNFETGEWLAYTVNVPKDGLYDIALRAASAFPNSAFHVEVDDVDVTKSVLVPNTGNWNAFQWVVKEKVALKAGQRVLKVVADQQYFNFNSIRVTESKAPASTPYSGKPIDLPGTFEAEDFDKGGEGLGYHDKVAGNAGTLYRPTEDVDIIASSDAAGGGYVVNNFQKGEWLAYTVNVPAAGRYDIGLRVASGFNDSAFRVELNGKDITGSVAIPNTGGWTSFQWVTKNDVDLPAGKHVLKIIADKEYFDLNSVKVTAAPLSKPYSGKPFDVPGTFEAEHFDQGGEGIGYHDKVKGNAGGLLRLTEDVDIIAGGSGNVVNNFETGEWLAYTINVPADGNYNIGVLASTAFNDSAFRAEIDGVDVTGRIAVPNTGGWATYQWVGKTGVPLSAGKHVLKIVSEQQYFNMDSVAVTSDPLPSNNNGSSPLPSPIPAPSPLPNPTNPADVQFFCSFENSPTDCGFGEQAKVKGRATLVSTAREGSKAVRLHTKVGDSNVNGSGSAERNDLALSQSSTDCSEGKEQWWAFSILFPNDYVPPSSGGWGVAMDFHHTGGSGQANFHIDAAPNPTGLRLRGYGGSSVNSGFYEKTLGPVVKNKWYDFVLHVKWSSNGSGFMHTWLDGKKVLTHYGPTLYSGMGCYLKLANYHTSTGQDSSIIHDRVIRGSSPSAVSSIPLEGVNY